MVSFGEKERSLSGLIAKITLGGVWLLVNIVIFLVAPIFIVGILLDFGVPLNMPIVNWMYVLGSIVVGFAVIMGVFNYGTKKRALSALGYTVVVISFLLLVLISVSGETMAQIEVQIEEIILYTDVSFFSNVLIGTVIGYGVIYSIELVAVVKKVHENFKHVYSVLKIGSAVCICLFLVTASFFMIVLFSATQIGGYIEEPPEYRYNFREPLNGTDDTVDITYNFTINNGGFLPIYEITFRLDLYVNDSTSMFLTPGLFLGYAQKEIASLKQGTSYFGNLTIVMDAAYTPFFIVSNTSLLIRIYVETTVTDLLPVAINISTYAFFSLWMLIY